MVRAQRHSYTYLGQWALGGARRGGAVTFLHFVSVRRGDCRAAGTQENIEQPVAVSSGRAYAVSLCVIRGQHML
jgi:hypothetical protein